MGVCSEKEMGEGERRGEASESGERGTQGIRVEGIWGLLLLPCHFLQV